MSKTGLFLLFILCLSSLPLITARAAPPNQIAPQDLEDLILSLTAKDVLNQIEGNVSAPPSSFDGKTLFLYFDEGSPFLSEDDKALLSKEIVSNFNEKGDKRIKIISHAFGKNEALSRQQALEQAIKVQEFLRRNNIPLRLIDVFPMGNQMPKQALDRVEVYID